MPFFAGSKDSRYKQDWMALGWAFLFFWYFSGVYDCLLWLSGLSRFSLIRHSILASTFWLVPLLWFPSRARSISAAVGILLWALSLVPLGYFCIYHQEFSQNAMLVVSESNLSEMHEFVAQFIHWWMIPIFLAYSAAAVLLWLRIAPSRMPPRTANSLAVLFLCLSFVYPCAPRIRHPDPRPGASRKRLEAHLASAVPWQIVFSYLDHKRQMDDVQAMLEKSRTMPGLGHFNDANSGQPATLVLVIGESANRQHMSLYGYPRATTPGLEALREDLTVFTHAVSPFANTLSSLQHILALPGEDRPDWSPERPTLVGIMKQAGYKTFWITNQVTMDRNNTLITYFSRQTDEQAYLNHDQARDSGCWDEVVFEPFRRALHDTARRKFVVVHLLGAHYLYPCRYPPAYGVFDGHEDLPGWATAEQAPTLNSYDNALRYNDFVLTRLIGMMASSRANGFLLYFSDHGEDVFDSPGHSTLGHNEDKPTAPMYEVPLVLWASGSWKAAHPRDFTGMLDRPYCTSGLIHTWSDLAGLSFDGFDPSRSIASPKFKERPLLVGNRIFRRQDGGL
ncbi:MAG TPA: phosphoethanolamine transferase CptA [Holophaga sp.]|nr:phosphoethanolamine transferase CptA [Holophaga sp.]HPS67481.1 phosphoethanolamine transferase CptA [Holophaga sp.]